MIKKNTYDCRLAVLAAEPKAVLVLTSFFPQINFDQISFSYDLSTGKET